MAYLNNETEDCRRSISENRYWNIKHKRLSPIFSVRGEPPHINDLHWPLMWLFFCGRVLFTILLLEASWISICAIIVVRKWTTNRPVACELLEQLERSLYQRRDGFVLWDRMQVQQKWFLVHGMAQGREVPENLIWSESSWCMLHSWWGVDRAEQSQQELVFGKERLK